MGADDTPPEPGRVQGWPGGRPTWQAIVLALAAAAALVWSRLEGGAGATPPRPAGALSSPNYPLPCERLDPYPDLRTALDPVCAEPPATPRECPEGMAFVVECGGFCIDRYEASRGPNGKAESKPGAQPWVEINWADAKAACVAAGKRLCKDYEWMAACDLGGEKYFLTDEESGEAHNCRTHYERAGCGDAACMTGSEPKCSSAAGVADMVGNVWEWTDALVPDGSWSSSGYVGEVLGETKAKYGDDYFLGGSKGNAFLRGGGWIRGSGDSPWDGCFDLDLSYGSSVSDSSGGFRCCAG